MLKIVEKVPEKVPYLGKKVPKYYCECCDYKCSHKSHYNKHLLTKKHKKNSLKNVENPLKKVPNLGKTNNHENGKKEGPWISNWKNGLLKEGSG